MLTKNIKLLSVLLTLCLGLLVNTANASLITETWEIEINSASGDYGLFSVGDTLELTGIYDNEGTYMDFVDFGRICLSDSATTGVACDEENFADDGWNVLSNALIAMTTLFDTAQVVLDGNTLINPGLFESSTFLSNISGLAAFISYNNSVLMQAVIEGVNVSEFVAQLYYQDANGTPVASSFSGTVVSRSVTAVSEPGTLAIFSLALISLVYRRVRKH
jgi:hypothetical protein